MTRMIPEFDVEIFHEYVLTDLRTSLTAEDLAEGFTEHQGYECTALATWEDVKICLHEEAQVLDQARGSQAVDGLEEAIDALSESDDLQYAEHLQALWGNDAGAASLALALSAARTATFYSCSGSLDTNHHADHPQVGVVPDVGRAKLIAELAEGTNCGIWQHDGRWYIYAKSVTDLHALSRLLLKEREAFDALPSPPWLNGLPELLDASVW
ncbi:hypothetical protein ACFFN5_01765 [Streptomonospora salina]